MAKEKITNNKKNYNQTKTKNINKQPVKNTNKIDTKKNKEKNNKFIMSALTVLGVLILGFILVYLMNYFFVKKNHLHINMSTDKKFENITINGKEQVMTTQKYVSDLQYNMRYDINDFSVFKYKEQDIFKYANDARVLFVVEKSTLPESCTNEVLELEYNNCLINADDYTDYYYISTKNETYKITVKSMNVTDYKEEVKTKVNYMLKNFEIKI